MDKAEWVKKIKSQRVLPSKSLGQNFLIDDLVSEKIIDAANITENDYILEIGPGMGALSEGLQKYSCPYVAVEIDEHMKESLDPLFSLSKKDRLIISDFLKLDYKNLLYDGSAPNICVSNLPYYVMTPIMMKLFRHWHDFHTMVFMVEKISCERIFSKPGSKQYGPLSIISSAFGEKEKLFDVNASAFFPPPHTISSVLRFTASDEKKGIPAVFYPFVHAAFSQRRKTLLNSLSSGALFPEGKKQVEDFLGQAKISFTERAENIEWKKYAEMACLLEDMIVHQK